MRRRLEVMLDSPRTVAVACGISLVLGLFFTFVWAPHPWGWQGIDQYHELARGLARGEPFATTDVPWGYAYFGAFFYAIVGERVWLPVAVQVVINAIAPWLLYRLIRPATTQRTAVLASLITGVFSFNTVYASTQASDAICTVLFLVSLLALSAGLRTGSVGAMALSGLLSGLVPQFRPNMILFPAIVAGGYVLLGRTTRHTVRAAIFLACVGLALTPWIVRNYRLTGTFMPTSTHGGVQLWYGTLQTGPYLENRARNPRSIFESSPLPYTSLANTSLVVTMAPYACAPRAEQPELVYWTDRSPRQARVVAGTRDGNVYRFEIPGQPIPTAIYYFFEATRPGPDGAVRLTSPAGAASSPDVAFVSDDHLRDMDRHNDLLDVFDIVRLARHLSWGDPLAAPTPVDLDRDGRITDTDLAAAVAVLLPEAARTTPPFQSLTHTGSTAVVRLSDGSTVSVPRSGDLHTDLDVAGNLAGALVSRWRPLASLTPPPVALGPDGCGLAEDVRLNEVFYRKEPHLMRRYMALAFDNITRDPVAFAAASAYRMVRLFIIRGTDDVSRAQQFTASRIAYTAGTVLSAAYFLVFLAGAWLAWRRGSALVWLLVPIAYVPLTICFVLTNMRYTITMQPLMFAFVAVAGISALGLDAIGNEKAGETV